MNSITFVTPEAQAKHVAEEVSALLASAITSRGTAILAVSGGKSPIRLFEMLRTQSIAWDRVTICLVDERWVPPDHARSNEKLVRDCLMQGNASPATFISVYNAGSTPVEAAAALSAMFSDAAPLSSPVDVAILGMGDDGHTASWFPRSRELGHCFSSRQAYAAVSAEEGRDARVTMTLSALTKARKIILCLEGDVKRAVLAKAAESSDKESMTQYPVSAVLRLRGDQVSIRVA